MQRGERRAIGIDLEDRSGAVRATVGGRSVEVCVRAGALDCTKLPSCPDRRVLVVLQGTDWMKPDPEIADVSTSGNDRAFPNPYVFPFHALPHPLPGAPGTTGYPPQQ